LHHTIEKCFEIIQASRPCITPLWIRLEDDVALTMLGFGTCSLAGRMPGVQKSEFAPSFCEMPILDDPGGGSKFTLRYNVIHNHGLLIVKNQHGAIVV
jgi:hypothetical protein